MKRENNIKRIVIVICAIILGFCCVVDGMAEPVYAGESNYNFAYKESCPAYDLDMLMTDRVQIEVSKALRSWFISEYAYADDWYKVLWEHTATILLEPYIIKLEYVDESSFTVYCCSAISSYSLFESESEQRYLAQGYETIGLFRVSFEEDSHSDCRVISVYRIDDIDEELFPGAGVGTDGFPGLSDELATEIPDWGIDTCTIAQKYIEQCKINAEIIMW